LIWVPVARKSSRRCIVAGWTPAVAFPWFRARPYRRRNPPTFDGWPKTGRFVVTGLCLVRGIRIARGFAARVLRGLPLVGLALPDGAVDEVLEPRPLHLLEVPGVTLDLRRLQCDSLREHEAHATAGGVRLDSFEVAEAVDLLVARGLPVQHHRTVLGDELRLLVLRGVLETRLGVVERDLLGVALDLVVPWRERVDVQQRAGVVRDEHGERLSGPARRPDRTGVVDGDVLAAVVVGVDLHAVDALDGRRDHALRQQGDGRPDRTLDLPGFRLVVADPALDEVLDEFEGGLLAAHLALQFADALGDAVDAEDVLDAVGHVLRDRNLDLWFGVLAALLGGLGDVEGVLEPRFQRREVRLVFRPHYSQRSRSVAGSCSHTSSVSSSRTYTSPAKTVARSRWPASA
jgi:hypothetical protein